MPELSTANERKQNNAYWSMTSYNNPNKMTHWQQTSSLRYGWLIHSEKQTTSLRTSAVHA